MKRYLSILVIFLSLVLHVEAVDSHRTSVSPNDGWVGTWAAAPQFAAHKDMPAHSDLSGSALRQIIHVSVGGDVVRLQLSNEYSTSPVEIKSLYIADAADSCDINPRTVRYVTFHKKRGVTLQAGTAVMSDVVKYHLRPLQRLAITVNYGATPAEATAHLGSRTTSYIIKGEALPSTGFASSERVDHWFNISALDVRNDEAETIPVLGNSITDGRGSTTNMQNRWTDSFAEALNAGNAKGQPVGVLNLGIGGNSVLRGGLGTPAVGRFQRDILSQRGVKRIIIFEGVNDIGGSNGNSEEIASQLIAAYQQFIALAHEHGLKVYGATITPFRNHYYYTPFHEAARQVVNEWIRTAGHFDGVIDFDKLMRDPSDPTAMRNEVQSDWLHPNATGYAEMGRYAAEIIK